MATTAPEALRMAFVAEAASVARVRWAIEEWAADLPDATRADLLLLSSELISNAVRFGPPRSLVRLLAERRGRDVRVEVVDGGPATALPPDAADTGRGLQVVDRIAAEWGTSTAPTTVWFVVAGERP